MLDLGLGIGFFALISCGGCWVAVACRVTAKRPSEDEWEWTTAVGMGSGIGLCCCWLAAAINGAVIIDLLIFICCGCQKLLLQFVAAVLVQLLLTRFNDGQPKETVSKRQKLGEKILADEHPPLCCSTQPKGSSTFCQEEEGRRGCALELEEEQVEVQEKKDNLLLLPLLSR